MAADALARVVPPSRALPVPGVGRHRWLVELIRARAAENADFELEARDDQGRLGLSFPGGASIGTDGLGRRYAAG